MQTWIALFRGINVGGKNALPMAKLRSDLESIKLTNVRSYIQSGNIVFESNARTASSLQKKIVGLVEARHGFSAHLLVLQCDSLLDAIQSNPFPDAVADPKSLHFFFLSEPATAADTKAMGAARKSNEEFELTDEVFYLHAPDGIGRSKLAANAEKYLGVVATARNYRTVDQLSSLITKR
ncbi:MAG: DUF1697 domain-containing protein [Planctomycetota bacterium]